MPIDDRLHHPLHDEERRKYEQALVELRTLHRVADELSRSLDLDVVLGRCLDLGLEAANAAAGVLYLHDEARDVFRLAQVRNVDESIAPPLFTGEGLRKALPGDSLQLDCTADHASPIVVAAYRAGIRRVVMLALRREGGELVGFLGAHFREGTELPSSTIGTLEAIARHEAIALENARAHDLLARRRRMAEGLRELSERALACEDDAELSRAIVEGARELTGNDRALLSRVFGPSVRVVAAVGAAEDLIGFELPATVPYIADALERHDLTVREDTSTLDFNTEVGRVVQAHGTRSFMLAPIHYRGKPIGILYVASGTPRTYAPMQRQALQIVAAMAGEALERMRALEELNAEKRRLDAILERLPLPVQVLGPGGERLHVNAAARAFVESLGGIQDDWKHSTGAYEALGREGGRVPREELPVPRAFRGEEPPPTELTLLPPNGIKRTVIVVAAPLRAADGSVEAVVTGLQDVTSLRELADAKDQFLRIASHELRSPLTALRATTSLLEIDPSAIVDEERRGVLLDRVQRQVARLTRLVEQLIDSARLNATEAPLERAPMDLSAVCREVIGAMPDASRVQLDAPAPVEGEWDAARLEQVLSNLLSNAARYSPAQSPIRVRVRREGAEARVEVSDRGIGVPPDQLDKVFSPFFRATNAAAQSKGGLGLGLHIAHEIVRRHGGTLTVRSKLGEGSTFTMALPVDRSEGAADSRARRAT